MTNYGMCVTCEASFDATVEQTRTALAEHGFGVLTEIDVAATMKTKLDIDMLPHLILGACNPQLAHEALTVDASLGLLLPCNVVIRTLDRAHTLVEALDPRVMVGVTNNTALEPVAERARDLLTKALADLGGIAS